MSSDEHFLNQLAADMAVQSVVQAAIDLKDARMDNATADFILKEETKITFAVQSLLITLDDIKKANANKRAA